MRLECGNTKSALTIDSEQHELRVRVSVCVRPATDERNQNHLISLVPFQQRYSNLHRILLRAYLIALSEGVQSSPSE